MAISIEGAQHLLRMFVAQETSGCPSYLCPSKCYMGLLTGEPAYDSSTSKYTTYELNGTRPQSRDTTKAPGYERALLGEILNGSIVETNRVMSLLTGTSKTTSNEKVFIFGENISKEIDSTGWNWPTITHFGIFNSAADTTIGESTNLVLWGPLSADVVVAPEQVPLFRINNFSISFDTQVTP